MLRFPLSAKIYDKTQNIEQIYSGQIRHLDYSLVGGIPYRLTLDPSTTCTGATIRALDNSRYFVMDFVRGLYDVDKYYQIMFTFLQEFLRGYELEMILMEDIPISKYAHSGRVLKEMKGNLDQFVMQSDVFHGVKRDKILPQVWHSMVVDKTKSKNRARNKKFVAMDICEKLPFLTDYMSRCPGSDYDGIESAGLDLGYDLKGKDSNGLKINYTTANPRDNIKAFICRADFNNMKQSIRNNPALLNCMRYKDILGLSMVKENCDLTLMENLKMGTRGSGMTMLCIYSELSKINLCYECGITYRPGMDFIVILINNDINKKSITNPLYKHCTALELSGLEYSL